MNLVAGQAGQPGENIVASAVGLVVGQVADGAQECLLHDLFAQVAIAADAVEAKAVERREGAGDEAVDRVGIAAQCALPPSGVEVVLQAPASFALRTSLSPSPASAAVVLCAGTAAILRAPLLVP